MLKKLTVVIVLLLAVKEFAYADMPSALDVYNQIYSLQPGFDVKVAFNKLGTPQEKLEEMEIEGIGLMPAALLWNYPPDKRIVIFFKNATIESTVYTEIYSNMKFSSQRYEELKEGFYGILGTPLGEIEGNVLWRAGNFTFTLNPPEDNYVYGVRSSNLNIVFKKSAQ